MSLGPSPQHDRARAADDVFVAWFRGDPSVARAEWFL